MGKKSGIRSVKLSIGAVVDSILSRPKGLERLISSIKARASELEAGETKGARAKPTKRRKTATRKAKRRGRPPGKAAGGKRRPGRPPGSKNGASQKSPDWGSVRQELTGKRGPGRPRKVNAPTSTGAATTPQAMTQITLSAPPVAAPVPTESQVA